MNNKHENIIVNFLIVLLFIVFSIIVLSTTNSFGGGDHFSHFKLAYWGWKYPDMLFNHWGKPVFTVLISPFAQFGMTGARMFNVLMGLATAFFAYKIAIYFKFKQAWVTILLVLFTPVYFILMFTSLTEVTYSFFLVLAIFLFFKKKHIWSAVILSFLPLVRTEGIVLIPLFIIAWTLKKKFYTLPFLSVGFLLISFLGWIHYNSFWWLITEMPYTGSAKEIYGSGSLFHFITHYKDILGVFLGIIFLFGMAVMLYRWTKKDHFKINDDFYFILLVVGSFVGFLAAHSFAWWKGIGNSLGLIRIIGSVTPLAAIIAMAAIDSFFSFKRKWWPTAATILLLTFIYFFINEGIDRHKYGFKVSVPQKMISEVVEYIKENQLDRHKIYYYNVYFPQAINVDPRVKEESQKHLPKHESFLTSVPDSSIIVWDAHFGSNEGRMPFEKLNAEKELVVLKVFKPEKPFTVLGGHDYQIVVFQKDLSKKAKLRKLEIDFENAFYSSTENVFKGDESFKLEKNKKYKTLSHIIFQEISDTLIPIEINVQLAFNSPEELNQNQILLVCTLESESKPLKFEGQDLWSDDYAKNTWKESIFNFQLPNPKSVDDQIKIYIWNKEGYEIFLDEIIINITPR